MRKLQSLMLAGALVLGLTSTAGAVTEDEIPLQAQIDEVLAKTEGGVQISKNEIAWHGGEAIMSFPLPGESKAPISSPAAQRLQAKVAGKPAGTVEPAATDVSIQADDGDCPTEIFGNDWYCFYQNDNFGGRRLQWNATHRSPVYFSDYDFENKVSSWSNKGGKQIYVYENFWVGRPTHLWTEEPHSRDSSVPNSVDNRAESFTTS
ncbi:peptidase inhibitor family I36 protein [Streptomyces chartreusis]|uniref:peptidase inhibitor family I36 protein n=1 Tax=Streptomyces chartreusis TaxID=1969 RepID=UPI0036FD86C1